MHSSYLQLIPDEDLVRRARAGNLRAYDELVRRFRGAVTFIAEQSVHSRAVAEEVAQEVFVLAFKSLPRLREPARFAGWLYAITRHRAGRVASQEQRSIATEPAQLDSLRQASPDNHRCPATALAESQRHTEISDALVSMPDEYRTVLLLRYYEQWPIARIAAFLSLPPTTVNWRLYQARKHLRRSLTEPGKETDHDRHEPDQPKRKRNQRDLSPALKDG